MKLLMTNILPNLQGRLNNVEYGIYKFYKIIQDDFKFKES